MAIVLPNAMATATAQRIVLFMLLGRNSEPS